MPTFSSESFVDVDLEDFSTDELIEELASRGESTGFRRAISEFEDEEVFAEVEARGHYVAARPTDLTQSEIRLLLSLFPTDYKVGGEHYFVYDKLVQAMQYAKI